MVGAAANTVSASSQIHPSSGSESETLSRQSRHSFKISDSSSSRDSSTTSTSPDGKPRRKSVFTEIGLDDFDEPSKVGTLTEQRLPRPRKVRFRTKLDIHEPDTVEEVVCTSDDEGEEHLPVPPITMAATASTSPFPSMPRVFMFVFMLAFILPTLNNSPWFGKGISPIGVKGGVIRKQVQTPATVGGGFEKRDGSPTDICKRWSQQSAVVNGTMYLYGGRLTTDSQQTSNTWNNDFLTLDLTKGWQIGSPTLKGLPQPSGPPPVANGYLWNSYDSLYLYGGEFSDTPVTSPVPFALWEYEIGSKSWKEHDNPQTSLGTNSDGGNQPVQRSAEGAGLNIPELGKGYYFGGHLDGYTTEGWSQSIFRVYLKSMIEFTFPGYANSQVQILSNGQTAGADGVWRNITEGGLQDSAGFTERADGVLVYVPGFGKHGIILGLAGGTNTSFTQMNVIDVFDIASSTWYKQATSGPTPEIRVNPCAVAASAADGSSTQVYMFGGQNLIPYGSQTQYSDMWILTIPSFTWIKVDTTNQAVPYGRAGHTCNLWNGQMVVVGGYVGQDLSCDSPGIYVFDASELTWNTAYTALSGGNALNQQPAQQKDGAALGGSYGYKVPKVVQSVIGGNEMGKATITAPAQAATDGPLATGKPVTYTVTDSHGATVTETGTVSPNSSSNGAGSSNSNSGSGGHNIAAIVAGVVAGLLFLLAAYLAFCVWVYRRQLTLYKNHVAMTQRAQGHPADKLGFMMATPFPSSSETPSTNDSGVRVSNDRTSGPSSNSRQSHQSHQHNTSDGSASGYAAASGAANGLYVAVPPVGGGGSSTASSTEDLMAGVEPSFLGVLLSPRRSLRVINRD